jgi:hypothetical protein
MVDLWAVRKQHYWGRGTAVIGAREVPGGQEADVHD